MSEPFDKITFSEHLFLFPRLTFPLAGIVSSTGSSMITSKLYNWDGRRRGKKQFSIFQWTISGRGALKFEDESYDVLPHQAMLLQLPHRHRYFLPKDSTHWQILYITLWGPELYRLMGELIRKRGPLWTLQPQSPPVQTALKIYESVFRSELTTPFAASKLAYQLVMELGDHAFPPPRRNSRFASLRSYVEEHLDQNLNVAELAERANLSRYHFSREFRSDEGISPSDFLSHTRVEAAARLLGDRTLSIKEIASRSGFHTANYMTKVFKRFFGCSPRELRKREYLPDLRKGAVSRRG
jgi:AraC-like DNA-binding protein